MIKLRFLTQDSFVSWAIRAITWSNWSHVEFVLPNNEGYLGAQASQFGNIPAGVQIRPFNYLTPSKEVFGIINCDQETTDKVLAWARSKIGAGYDYTQIFGDMVHNIWSEPNTYDCSYFTAAAFIQANAPLLNIDNPARVTPQDIYQSAKVAIQST